MYRLEQTIIKNLIYNEEYCRKTIPFLKEEYFTDRNECLVFKEIEKFITTYKVLPTHEALVINFTESSVLKEEEIKEAITILNTVHAEKNEPTDTAWLLDETEKFCQNKAIYNAVLESVSILDDKSGKKQKGAIPDILTKALAVSFDTHIGHDYLGASEDRFAFYHKKERKLPFDLVYLNKITKGGLSPKTLNIILAGTGVGKTLCMCHIAAGMLSMSKNVLYITLEMAEERIAERIDANLLNIPLDDLMSIPKSDYDVRVANVRNRTQGTLIIKEYPTAAASSLNFRSLLNELLLKKSFRPDIMFIDYLNICTSARIKLGSQVNSYTYVKTIAEELRGLGVEFDIPVVSATQTTRAGFDNSDLGLTDTSESFGLPATADLMLAVVQTEELEQLNQYLFKQLKNRYDDVTKNKRFVVGVDKSKMRLYDVEDAAQKAITDSGQPVGSEKHKEQLVHYLSSKKTSNFKDFKF